VPSNFNTSAGKALSVSKSSVSSFSAISILKRCNSELVAMVAPSEDQARHCYEFSCGRFNAGFASHMIENLPKVPQKSKSLVTNQHSMHRKNKSVARLLARAWEVPLGHV
jgi:hypothetical protein